MRKRKKPLKPVYLEDVLLDLGVQLRVLGYLVLDIYEDMMLPVLNAMAFYIGLRQVAKRTPRDALYDTLLWIKRNPTQPW